MMDNCILCGDEIDIQYLPHGQEAWTHGHNAEPLALGRCCSLCNDTKVIPARLHKAKLSPTGFIAANMARDIFPALVEKVRKWIAGTVRLS
jgi:hypothetical protein